MADPARSGDDSRRVARQYAAALALAIAAGLFAAPTALPAQSPLVIGGHSTCGIGWSSAVQVYCDVTVYTPLTILQIDNHASVPPGEIRLVTISTCPGSHAGNLANPAAWTRQGTGVLRGGATPTDGSITDLSIPLQPGSYGMCISFDRPLSLLVDCSGPGRAANRDLAIRFDAWGVSPTAASPRAGGGVAYPASPMAMHGKLHYQLGTGQAAQTVFGTGCGNRASSFYEAFAGPSFDLGGTPTAPNTIAILPLASGGHLVLPGSSAWHVPATPPLPLRGSLMISSFPLGFTFPWPGGSTTAIAIAACGAILLEPPAPGTYGAGALGPYTMTVGGAVLLPQCCNQLWVDHGGSISFDTDPVNQVAYVTWDNVADFGIAGTSSFQAALFSTGRVEFRYRQANGNRIATAVTLVGLSHGHRIPEPPPSDISNDMPILTGQDNPPLSLTAAGRPITGASVLLDTRDVPSQASAGVLVLGLVGHDPGLPLQALGMGDCRQYASADAALFFLPQAPRFTRRLDIPGGNALLGVRVHLQEFLACAGFNPLGVLASNGLRLTIGP